MRKSRMIMAAVLAASLMLSAPAAYGGDAESVETIFGYETGEETLSGAEETAGESGNSEASAESDVTVSRIRFAKDYEEVFKALQEVRGRYDYYVLDDDMVEYEAAAADTGATSNAVTAAKTDEFSFSGNDYSETNVRTEGVDEADIVKTDGKYICILRKHEDLSILEVTENGPVLRSTIHICEKKDWGWNSPGASEFFMNGSLLHIISSELREPEEEEWYNYNATRYFTTMYTYDISDPVNPVLTGTVQQDGRYHQARMNGGKIYLFSVWTPVVTDTIDESSIRPQIGGAEAEADHICIPSVMTDQDYLIVSSVDPKQPSKTIDYKVLISGAEQLYVSTEGIYAINVDYDSYQPKSEIVKFTYADGMITGRAAARLRGEVNDTFSIDEYNGYLRVLTTYTGSLKGEFMEALSDLFGFYYYDEDRWLRHNAIYILDEGMNRVGSLLDLAEGEEIKSARYFGDTAYFVTFRNTDPLFTADLSNPAAPKIIGETKLPGFSAYLHPFGGSLMLGLGYDADESNGRTTGVKISLFDFSDPTNVVETARTTIPNITWCPAIEDYKAVFADADRKLVGFFCENHYMVYHMKEDGSFERVMLYDFFEDSLQGDEDYTTVRGLFIGSDFYLAGGSFVSQFDMNDGFAKKAVVRLD